MYKPNYNLRPQPFRRKIRAADDGFTLPELMVIIGIIGVLVAVGVGRQEPCQSAIRNITTTLANDIVSSRMSARANNATVNIWFGYDAKGIPKPGDTSSVPNNPRSYVRHVDLNSNLAFDPGEQIEVQHMSCSGSSEALLEFGLVSGAPALTDATGTHSPEADGVNLGLTSPGNFANVLSFGPGGVANTLTPTTDTFYLRVRESANASAVRYGRAVVIRLNGKSLVYGYDPRKFNSSTWVSLR